MDSSNPLFASNKDSSIALFCSLKDVLCPAASEPSHSIKPLWHSKSFATPTKAVNDEHRLITDLLRNYDASVRPVYNASKVVEIMLGLTLITIYGLDEKKQALSLNVWLEHEWYDERIHWNASHYGNLTQIRLMANLLWTPDIVIYNNAADYDKLMEVNIAAHDNGALFWAPPIKLRSVCKLDIALFPFDDQICKLSFGSWSYDEKQLNVVNRSSTIAMESFMDSSEFEIVSYRIKRELKIFMCCPVAFPVLEFVFQLRRRVQFYVYNIVVPCTMLCGLALVQFLLPVASGEKVTLGLTVFLAYNIFSLNIEKNIPETSTAIPLLTIWMMTITLLSACAVALSVVVINVSVCCDQKREPPDWMRFIAYRCLAPLIRWKSPTANTLRPQHLHRLLQCAQDASEMHNDASAELINLLHNESCHVPWQTAHTCLDAWLLKAKHLLCRYQMDLEMNTVLQQWHEIQSIIDRVFFWLVLLVSVGSSVCILAVAPRFSTRAIIDDVD